MNETPIPVSALDRLPPPPPDVTASLLEKARAACPARKIVVLDDDPTGVQTVHGVPVYTDWEEATLARAMAEGGPMFFVLTNSRAFSAAETARVHAEIAGNLARAAQSTGRDFLLVSRSDSTLRGHYPLETAVLRRELEARLPLRFDGEVLMPYFAEGGRFTLGGVHYVRSGGELVPAGQTEFARDNTFGYRASFLPEWIEERTGGAVPADTVCRVTIEELRAADVEGAAAKLCRAHDFAPVAVDAAGPRDAEVFAAALFTAMARGKNFLLRTAAGILAPLGGIAPRPLLTAAELGGGGAGLVLAGSHVHKTTAQLERLLGGGEDLCPICFDVTAVLREGGLTRERDRALSAAESALRRGKTAVVYTSRQVLRAGSGASEDDLRLSVEISGALSSLAALLHERPAFLIAKGGITSSDVGVKGLGVRRAVVLGQLLPGVPVWRTGEESRFPGLPYVIFPGNVGGEEDLLTAVRLLSGKGAGHAQ